MLKSKGLTERQRIIVGAIRMRLTEKQALTYLKEEHGIEISGATYRRDKLKLKQMTQARLYNIAQIGYEDQHLGAIDETENAMMLMYREFRREEDPLKRCQILAQIINLKPLLSAYYDTTKSVIEKPEPKEDNTIQESEGEQQQPQPQPNEWV